MNGLFQALKAIVGYKSLSESNNAGFLQDLYNVGKTKSLGYLPLESIADCHSTVAHFVEYAAENNLKTLLFRPGECHIVSGALYLYSEDMLNKILGKYPGVLSQAQIPHDSVNYVRRIARESVMESDYPNAYRVIGLTFNDKRFAESKQNLKEAYKAENHDETDGDSVKQQNPGEGAVCDLQGGKEDTAATLPNRIDQLLHNYAATVAGGN